MKSRHFDIRVYKRNLRRHYKDKRKNMPPEDKDRRDEAIYRAILSMPQYQKATTILTFVSTDIEVDTHKLIHTALAAGKTVAVPYCIDGTREMQFYRISSLDELIPRTFGVLEPEPDPDKLITDFSGSICVLPGLSFDYAGYRLGYGGGYYDRFLSKVYTTGTKVGVCYNCCTRQNLTHGRYDVPCDYLVTESGLRKARTHQLRVRRKNPNPKCRKKGKSP